MFQFTAFYFQLPMNSGEDDYRSSRVAPFGDPRIKAYLQLPEDYRS